MSFQFGLTALLTAVGLLIGAVVGQAIDGTSQPMCWFGAIIGFFLSFGACILDD